MLYNPKARVTARLTIALYIALLATLLITTFYPVQVEGVSVSLMLAVEIIRYLETPPTEQELRQILNRLGLEPRQLMRKGEKEYREQHLDNDALSEDELIHAMGATPRLIERPIVVHGNKAALGRPPENVLTLF